MKLKRLFVLLLLLISLGTLHSLEGEFSLSLGVLGLGFDSDMKTFEGYGYARLLNFMYLSENGLGLNFSPLVFFYKNMDNYSLTFVNGSIFYNFLKNADNGLILGPLIGTHAVQYKNPSFVEFRTGLFFSFRNADNTYAENSLLSVDIFFVELGYKYNKKEGHGIYAYVGVDLLAALELVGLMNLGSYEDYKKKNKEPWEQKK